VNSQEAKETLLLYRPNTADDEDADFADALVCAKNDPELKTWFEQHCAMQRAVFSSFERIKPPEGLKEQIISEREAHMTWGSRRKAAVLVFATLAIAAVIGWALVFSGPRPDKSFATFRARMAGTVLRYPKMDLETNDLRQIRQYLAEHNGQKDYLLSAALEKTAGTGCAILNWHGNRISMVCFHSGRGSDPKDADLFLFIVDRSAVSNAPAGRSPEAQKVKGLATASWSEGNKTFILAGTGDEKFLQQYY
jgi:hypothetical protein